MNPSHTSTSIAARLERERGTLFGHGRRRLSLVYPSAYAAGMSSLGFQTVYRLLNQLPDTCAERAFLPDEGDKPRQLLTYESGRPAADAPVVAFSVAYEIELAGFFDCVALMGLAARRSERRPTDPLVLAGGPLTFSNPLPLGPFVDAVLMGEAEDLLEPVVEICFGGGSRDEVLRALAALPGVWVPSLHGESLPAVAQCDDAELPAQSQIITPDAALSDMFLIEPARGCSRGCTFCVMRRSTNGGMRIVDPKRVAALIPEGARRVGLVGAAVTDHPRITDIVRHIVDSGREIGISSLRADRLDAELVGLLKQGGYRTLTVASDGASERLRDQMEKRIRQKHMLSAAHLARDAGIGTYKVYMMLGVPDETDDDVDALIAETLVQAEAFKPGRVAMGVATFVAKRNTPLDGLPFIGVRNAERRMERLRRGLAGRVEVRPVSARWAHIEYELAQGSLAAGEAFYQGYLAGGRYADYRKAFEAIAPEQERYRLSRAPFAAQLQRKRPIAAVLPSPRPAPALAVGS